MNIFANLAQPEIVFKASTEFNQDIQVVRKNNVYKLLLDGVVQSVSTNSRSVHSLYWGAVARLIRTHVQSPRRALILGLGGASIQHLLHAHFPDLAMVSVEIDPVVVEVSRKFFDLDTLVNHKVIVANAFRVVAEPQLYGLSPQSFDVAVVDILQGDTLPSLASSGQFLASLKDLMLPGGFVVVGHSYKEDHQLKADALVRLMEDFFSDVSTEVLAGATNSDKLLIYGWV